MHLLDTCILNMIVAKMKYCLPMKCTYAFYCDEHLVQNVHIQHNYVIISSPGRSPGRAIVLPPASALASASGSASVLAKC